MKTGPYRTIIKNSINEEYFLDARDRDVRFAEVRSLEATAYEATNYDWMDDDDLFYVVRWVTPHSVDVKGR